MDTKKYNIIVTETCQKEIKQIYDYISNNLYADKAAKRLMGKVEKSIKDLKHFPYIHSMIKSKYKNVKENYRRMIINNYVILYLIDEDEKNIYISHMFYSKSNYLKKI